jgi:hypothetical protein
MDVDLVVHIEPDEESKSLIWWADSDDVPGFYAAGASLKDLQIHSMLALAQVFADASEMLGKVTYSLSPDSGVSDNPVRQGDAEPSSSVGSFDTAKAIGRLVPA